MQVEQTGVSKYINSSSGASASGQAFYRLSVASNDNEVLTFYCDVATYNKVSQLSFGDEVQLIFDLHQWKSGINVRIKEVFVSEKKNR